MHLVTNIYNVDGTGHATDSCWPRTNAEQEWRDR